MNVKNVKNQKHLLWLIIIVGVSIVANAVFKRYTLRVRSERFIAVAQEFESAVEKSVVALGAKNKLFAGQPQTLKMLDKLATGNDTSAYRDAYEALIKRTFDDADFVDFYLVDQHGTIAFTLNKKEVIGQSFASNHYEGLPMYTAVNLSRYTMTEDVSFVNKHSTAGKTTVCMCVPIMVQAKYWGVAAVEIDITHANKPFESIYHLGKTVEVLVGEVRYERLSYVYPGRLEPAIAGMERAPHDEALFCAAMGQQWSIAYVDYRGHHCIAAANYLPYTNLGLLVKQDSKEVVCWFALLHKLLLGLFVMLGLLLAAVALSNPKILLTNLITGVRWLMALLARAWVLAFLISIVAGLLLQRLVLLRTANDKVFQIQRKLNEKELRYEVDKFNISAKNHQKSVAFIAHELSHFTSQGAFEAAVKKALLFGRPKDLLFVAYAGQPGEHVEQPTLWTLKEGQLVSHRIVDARGHGTVLQASGLNTYWYTHTLKTGGGFLSPFYEPTMGLYCLGYAAPFYKNGLEAAEGEQPLGVIASVHLSFEAEVHIRQECSADQRKVAFADYDGNIIARSTGTSSIDEVIYYHRQLPELVEGLHFPEKQLSREQIWALLGQYIKEMDPVADFYLQDEIKSAGWPCAASFGLSERRVPVDQLRSQLIILSLLGALLLILLLLFFLRLPIFSRQRHRDAFFLVLLSCLLGILMVSLWAVVYRYSRVYENQKPIMMHRHDVKNAVEYMTARLSEHDKKPLQIESGIRIFMLDLASHNQLTLGAYVWQKIPNEMLGTIKPGVEFSRVIKKSEELVSTEKHEKYTTFTWLFNIVLSQQHDYKVYPLNKSIVQISFSASDRSLNTVLVPDFTTYADDARTLPWLDAQLVVPGFYLRDSYFNYTRQQDAKEHLTLTLLYFESMAGAGVNYLIPLLLIILIIFALLWIPVDFRLAAYSGIFFSTIMLHRSLRATFDISNIIYLEYFFCAIYLSLVLLVLVAIYIMMRRKKVEKSSALAAFDYYLRLVFWPIQFALWILATVITFYKG